MNLYELRTAFTQGGKPYSVVAESFNAAIRTWIDQSPTDRAYTEVVEIRLVASDVAVQNDPEEGSA